MSKKAKAEETAGCESSSTESGEDSQSPKMENGEHPFLKYLPDADPTTFPAVHPHANIFPMLPIEEMQVLADDIKVNGLKHDIIVVHIADQYGQDIPWILDGRNRWVACTMAGIDPIPHYFDETITLTKASKADPGAMLKRVITENLARRQLTATEKAIVAEQLAVAQRGGKQNGAFTVTQAAKQLGVSASNIGRARKLKETAPKIYAALMRKEYKNLDIAYRAAGLNKKPEMVFLVTDLGWKIDVSKEPLTPKLQNNPNVFKTKEEADARAKEWKKEKADAEAQAKAGVKQPEATPPKSKKTTFLVAWSKETNQWIVRVAKDKHDENSVAEHHRFSREDQAKRHADQLNTKQNVTDENAAAEAYADAHGLRYSIGLCSYQETGESHWTVNDWQEGGDTVTDYPPDADGKAQAQAEADRLNAQWQTSVKYRIISETDSAGEVVWFVEGYPLHMGTLQTEAEAQAICDRLNAGEKLNEEGYLDGEQTDNQKEAAENQSVDLVEMFEGWVKEAENAVGEDISVTDFILRHLLAVAFEEDLRGTATLVKEICEEVQAAKKSPLQSAI